VTSRLTSLFENTPVQIIIGDGNHSLAAARDYWDELKPTLGAGDRECHPARFALVELNNVYDPAIRFEAIHRLVSVAEPASLIKALETGLHGGAERAYTLDWTAAGQSGRLSVRAAGIGAMIETLQSFLDKYVGFAGGSIDYIHGEQSLRTLAEAAGNVGLLLPPMDKSDFSPPSRAALSSRKRAFPSAMPGTNAIISNAAPSGPIHNDSDQRKQ
jgi:hypothetical protein